MIYLLLVLAFFVGYYLQLIRNYLLEILDKLNQLLKAQDKDKAQPTTFAEPMTRAELAAMAEEERISLLNP